MKKAFYTLGTIYLAIQLAGGLINGIRHGIDYYHEEIEPRFKETEKKDIRRPIGFAVEKIES